MCDARCQASFAMFSLRSQEQTLAEMFGVNISEPTSTVNQLIVYSVFLLYVFCFVMVEWFGCFKRTGQGTKACCRRVAMKCYNTICFCKRPGVTESPENELMKHTTYLDVPNIETYIVI